MAQDIGSSAIIAAVVSLVVAAVSTLYNEVRFRRQHRAEAAIKKLLTARKWNKRSFKAIKRNVGGYEDDELRRLLVRAGAIRFYRSNDNEEMWGLLSKNEEELREEGLAK
jgi:hypothetical protein